MQHALQYISWAIGLWLNLLVILALARGTYRQYPFVLAYALALFVSTVAEILLLKYVKIDVRSYYWTNELVLEVLIFCMVIAFIDEAARDSKQKTIERHWLVAIAALIFAGSFIVHRSPHLNRQMTLLSRDLNICAVVLDLMLWSLLVAARRPNRRLMLMSGGLGLQLTGAIMGEQLRDVSLATVVPGQLLEVTTGFLGLYIWYRALRTSPVPVRATV